jgi:protein-L-isoaspartate(D-aspartate) O-methyltransferase
MDIEQARFNMIEQQVRPCRVLDKQVLELMSEVPREDFVPEAYASVAFADINVPLGDGQCMMSPKLEGFMLQALAVKQTDSVLEIGTGSGFVTALLAKSAYSVLSVDIRADFLERAGERLAALNIENVNLEKRDAINTRVNGLPYDVIAITGSVIEVPEHWLTQLSIGGRLFAIIGEAPVMEGKLMTRVTENEWHTDSLFETELCALDGVKKTEKFVF